MKHLFLLLLLTTSLVMGQKGPDKPACVIEGPIVDGNLYTFSISNSLAQCIDCHDWDITGFSTPGGGPVIQHSASDEKNEFTVEAISSGTFTLQVTYFNETGCHTCQKNITVTITEPCIEPEIGGKLYCLQNPPIGTVYLDPNSVDISNINNITWIFDPNDNPGNYNGFKFLGNNQTFIQSFNKASNFSEDFTMISGCPSNRYLCLDYNIEFEDPTTCGAGYIVGSVCGYLLDPSPFTTIFPNPADKEITVSLSNLKDKTVTLEVYNASGAKVNSKKVIITSNEYLQQIDLSKSSGKLLLLKVVENGKVIDTKKILR